MLLSELITTLQEVLSADGDRPVYYREHTDTPLRSVYLDNTVGRTKKVVILE